MMLFIFALILTIASILLFFMAFYEMVRHEEEQRIKAEADRKEYEAQKQQRDAEENEILSDIPAFVFIELLND